MAGRHNCMLPPREELNGDRSTSSLGSHARGWSVCGHTNPRLNDYSVLYGDVCVAILNHVELCVNRAFGSTEDSRAR